MTLHDSADTAQTEDDAPDGGDKPDIAKNQQNKPTRPPLASSDSTTVPLPPKEAGTYEKQPGHTLGSLGRLVMSAATTSSSTAHAKLPSMTSSSNTASPVSSPTVSEYDSGSAPSTRPPSQAPSRAPSMSAGTSGGKVSMTPSKASASATATATTPRVNGSAPTARSAPPSRKNSTSSPSAPPLHATPSEASISASSAGTVRQKAPSVHSEGGGHKFNLKDLLASGPKLSRKSSQRSTGSSRKSDTDSVNGDGRAKSTAGDSTASLTKKYGVCQKVAIGKGATSVVRLAHKWDRSEEKLYAVKEFRKRRKNESEKEYVKKLTAEFCISSTLHHINIVETVDLVQDENQHWCEVMEFCPGGDLYAAIKKGAMSPSEVECCFKQILTGVAYLHSQGVAHRDLKPENLFFDTKGHLKIGDYGSSTVYRLPWEATIHMSTGLCGSEPYIAPEQFLGKPYDARLVDIWACGIVYYCLHFSEIPWRVAQPSDALYLAYATACTTATQGQCPPTINNLSPRACRGLIRRMLEPDPKQRIGIEDVVKHPWITEIEVCHTVDNPKHVHAHLQALAQAQAKDYDR